VAETAGAVQFDPPTLDVLTVDRSSTRIQVTAGASGAPAGFQVEWMTRTDFDALGGWPTDPSDPALVTAEFNGVPTLTVMEGSSDYLLGPSEITLIEPGDLFDETGVITTFMAELDPDREYVFRAFTLGSEGTLPSPYTSDLSLQTAALEVDCTYTQGFWKTHPQAWPVGGLQLGDVFYTAEELLDIFNTPAAGNGLIFLAHQLIAAKLNVANGASNAVVQDFIDAADALIGSLVVPPIGGGYLEPSEASELTEVLDTFNNGELGSPHCDAVQTEESSWGGIKGTYR
jgi:hypothetical protein